MRLLAFLNGANQVPSSTSEMMNLDCYMIGVPETTAFVRARDDHFCRFVLGGIHTNRGIFEKSKFRPLDIRGQSINIIQN